MKNGILVISLFLVIATTGCTTQRSWVYYSEAQPGQQARSQSVVVLPFEDKRKNQNWDSLGWSIVPLVPFTKAELNVPEGKDFHVASGEWENFEPTEDFAIALAHEIEHRDLFENARFDRNSEGADYVVKGTILATDYAGTLYSYGLSVYAPVAWVLGLPVNYVSNQVSLQLELIDQKNGDVVVSKIYDSPEYERYAWIYNMKSDFEYPELTRAIYDSFVQDVNMQMARR